MVFSWATKLSNFPGKWDPLKLLQKYISWYIILAGNDADDKLDKISVYFNEANNFNYVPRSIMVDLVSSRWNLDMHILY